MPKFMIEETLASPAFSGMFRRPEDRGEVLRPIFEAVGCRLEQYYASGIDNKTYIIVEAPDLKNVFTVGATFMPRERPRLLDTFRFLRCLKQRKYVRRRPAWATGLPASDATAFTLLGLGPLG